MRWPLLRWFSVFVAALFLQDDWADAAPNPSSEDMMRELLKIDQLYSSIARPRICLGTNDLLEVTFCPVHSCPALDLLKDLMRPEMPEVDSLRSESNPMDDHPKVVQRAIIRLQELDRLYADRARPRFGKRTSESNARYAPAEYDSQYMNEQDVGDWLMARR